MNYLSTVSGNVVVVREQSAGKVHFDRVGHFADGESRVIPAETWATCSEDWFQSAMENGFFVPVVRMIGNSWMTEKDYIDSITV